MVDDPLYAPLGMTPPRPPRPRRVPVVTATALLVLLGAGAAAAFLARTPTRGGDSAVVAAIVAAPPRPAPPAPAAPAPAASAPAQPALPPGATVEVQNGVKIVRLNPAASSMPVTMAVDGGTRMPLAPAPDPRVTEITPDGPLPRLGKDGLSPVKVYGRATAAAGGPQVALVALGAGLDQLGSAEAARTLPAAIDFALAPDVPDAGTQVAELRRGGREVVLDLGAAPQPDAAALRRAMAAWPGYVAVRLPDGDGAAAHEAVSRGLVPIRPPGEAAGADIVVDATDPAALGSALTHLVGIARAKGRAVGLVANAIAGRDTLAQAAGALSSQGATLVPLSALAAAEVTSAGR